jgi:hypothetical protein
MHIPKSRSSIELDQDPRSTHLQVGTLSDSNHNNREEKGEFNFFIGEEEKLKARLDLLETDEESGDQELSRFFLGGENNKKDRSDHK